MKKIIFLLVMVMSFTLTNASVQDTAKFKMPTDSLLNEKIQKKDICGFLALFKFDCNMDSIQKNIFSVMDRAGLKINFEKTAARECAYWVSCYQHTPAQWVILMEMIRDNKTAFADGKLDENEAKGMIFSSYQNPPKSFKEALAEAASLPQKKK